MSVFLIKITHIVGMHKTFGTRTIFFIESIRTVHPSITSLFDWNTLFLGFTKECFLFFRDPFLWIICLIVFMRIVIMTKIAIGISWTSVCISSTFSTVYFIPPIVTVLEACKGFRIIEWLKKLIYTIAFFRGVITLSYCYGAICFVSSI